MLQPLATDFLYENIPNFNKLILKKGGVGMQKNVDNSNGWIKTTDKVPDNQKPVLVYIPPHTGDDNEDYIGYVGLAYYTDSARGGYWCGTDGNVYGAIGMIHSPTYWMSLPNPPEPI